MDMQIVEEYQKVLARDPGSRVFAALAESYRDLDLLDEAEEVSRRGLKLHPNYAPGYLALARVLIKKFETKKGKLPPQNLEEALKLLHKATELAADNVLAWQILGEALLLNKSPKEALRAHKMALFLNPLSRRSSEVIRSLESITADEFPAEIFQMKRLPALEEVKPTKVENKSFLERELSVIDALIVRQKPELAKERLQGLVARFPGSSEIQSRWQLVSGGTETGESAAEIKPLPRREALVVQKKIHRLENLLLVVRKKMN